MDDAATYQLVERGGLTFGAGLVLWPTEWLGVGLDYEHTDLGHERSDVGPAGAIDIERDLSTLWAALRVSPFRTEAAAVYLAVGPGLSWQSADATGVVFTGPSSNGALELRCEGSASLGLALRAGLGVEGRLPGGLVLFAETTWDAHRLSSEPLGTCVTGTGTAMLFGARAGAQYRFDVSRVVR